MNVPRRALVILHISLAFQRNALPCLALPDFEHDLNSHKDRCTRCDEEEYSYEVKRQSPPLDMKAVNRVRQMLTRERLEYAAEYTL